MKTIGRVGIVVGTCFSLVLLSGLGFSAEPTKEPALKRNDDKAAKAPSPASGKPTIYTTWPFDAKEAKRRQEETAKKLKIKTTVALNLSKGVSMKLILIPPGTFQMGSGLSATQMAQKYGGKATYYKYEHPQHTVKLTKAFYLGVTEVTQAQWKAVMGTTPWSGKSWTRNGAHYAASCVSWYDASSFCGKLSQKADSSTGLKSGKTTRLPTEAEWEYACRAGSKTQFCYGDDASQLGRYAWYCENAYEKGEKYPHIVGQKQPNAWGLYDMHGNVYEWCHDWYARKYPSTTQTDPKGPASGKSRILRGGSWGDIPGRCRDADRNEPIPDYRSVASGFRVVVVVK